MRGNLNLNGVEEQGMFTILPEGEYVVRVGEVRDKYSSKGDGYVAVKFTVMEGEHTGSPVWDNINFVPAILGRTKHFLHTIDQPYEGVIEYDSENWIDRELRITIKHEEYQGKMKMRVVKHDFLNEPVAPVTTTGDDPLAGTPFEE